MTGSRKKRQDRDRGKYLQKELARFEHTLSSGHAKLDENGKHTHSDTQSLHVYGEAKYRAVSKICTWLLETAAKAAAEAKVPVMAFKNWNMTGFVWATLSRFWINVPVFRMNAVGSKEKPVEYIGRLMILKRSRQIDHKKFYRMIFLEREHDMPIWIEEYKPKVHRPKKEE